jgi:hypothetical protein
MRFRSRELERIPVDGLQMKRDLRLLRSRQLACSQPQYDSPDRVGEVCGVLNDGCGLECPASDRAGVWAGLPTEGAQGIEVVTQDCPL